MKIAKDGHIKVSWKEIYEKFKKYYPHLAKQVTRWNPLDFATIEIFLTGDRRMSYNYDTNTVDILPEKKIKITQEMSEKIKERLGEN